MGLYVSTLKKCAVFSGRASRRELWVFTLVNALIGYGLVHLMIEVIPGPLVLWGSRFENPQARSLLISLGVALQDPHTPYSLIYLYLAAAVAMNAAVTVRRLHDTGRSGWWLLVNLIPFVGSLISAVLLVLPGDAGENAYGAPPGMPAHSASVSTADTKRSSLWKVYFGLGVAATIYTVVILGTALWDPTALWDLIAVVVNAVALAGLFAYAWQREVLTASFWRGFLPVLVVWTVAYQYVLPISPQMAEAMSLETFGRPLAATLNLAFDIPLFLAIYRQGPGRPALLS